MTGVESASVTDHSSQPPPGPTPQPPDRPRWRPQTVGGAVYLVVLAMVVVGLALTLAGAWRTGLHWIGAALIVAGSARLVLSERASGMLRVRRKWSDVLMLAVAGVGLVVLAVVVPNQR